MAFTLFIKRGDLADVQVLAAKLGGKAADALVLHHALHLRGEHIGLVEFAGGGELREFGIGRGGPEEVTQACGDLPIVHWRGLWSRRGSLAAIEKCRCHKNSRKHHAHSFGVRHLLRAQLLIKGAQFFLLCVSERATPCLCGEVEHGLHLFGLHFDLQFLEGLGSAHDRLPQRLQSFVAIGRVGAVL